jgi:cytidyltransferase-like protein
MIVGFKAGAFTLYHAGHSWMLERCEQQCDYLIVLINDDNYVRRKKGVVPISAEERAIIIKSHWAVKEVFVFSGKTEHEWLQNFKETRFYMQFGHGTYMRMFHSEELVGQEDIPGQGIVDDIVFMPKQSSPIQTSVSEIFRKIRDG